MWLGGGAGEDRGGEGASAEVSTTNLNQALFTFDEKCCSCLVCSTVTNILSFVCVSDPLDDEGSAFALRPDGHRLGGLDLGLIVVPHDIDVFAELTV